MGVEGRQPRQGPGKGRGKGTGVGWRHSREDPEETGRVHETTGMRVREGLWTPQVCQGLHGLLADAAGETIQWLLLDLPLHRGPQRDQ